MVPKIESNYSQDRRPDHELFWEKINHDDCVYDLKFTLYDLFVDI